MFGQPTGTGHSAGYVRLGNRLLKDRIAAVTMLDLDQEFLECGGTLPIDVLTGQQSDLPMDKKKARMREHYEALATSTSALDDQLASHLWGTLDTLRMASKLLGRRIFVLMESKGGGLGHYRIAPATHKQEGTLFFYGRHPLGWT